MRTIEITAEFKELEFAQRAARHFKSLPAMCVYTNDSEEPVKGELCAIRWGLVKKDIVVFTVGDEPRLYKNIIKDKQ